MIRSLLTRRPRILLSVVAGLLLAACGSGASTGTDETAGATTSITVPLSASLATLDPTQDVFAGNTVFKTLFQPLVDLSDADGARPDLALSWTTSDNGLTWTFELDPDATFSDGTPVTSEDVVFTIDLELQDSNPHAASLIDIKKVAAPDPQTVVFTLKEPNASFLTQGPAKYIVPKDYYTEVGADQFAKEPVGSGPFEYEAAVAGGGVTVVTNPDYSGSEQLYDQITFTVVPTAEAQVAGLTTGALDIVPNIATSQVDLLKASPGVSVVDGGPSTTVSFIAFDQRVSPTDDLDFRRAVSESIDRQALADTILGGYASVGTGFVTPPEDEYDESRAAPEYDAQQAAADLAASGYSGQTVTLTYPTSTLVNPEETAQAVAAYIEDIGVKVNLVPLDYTTFLQKWIAHDLEGMYLFQYTVGSSDPDAIFRSLAAEGSRAMFTDDEVFDQFTRTETETGDERTAAVAELQAMLFDEKVYYTPLLNPNALFGVRTSVSFTPNPIITTYVVHDDE